MQVTIQGNMTLCNHFAPNVDQVQRMGASKTTLQGPNTCRNGVREQACIRKGREWPCKPMPKPSTMRRMCPPAAPPSRAERHQELGRDLGGERGGDGRQRHLGRRAGHRGGGKNPTHCLTPRPIKRRPSLNTSPRSH